jgi:hypothetical protein
MSADAIAGAPDGSIFVPSYGAIWQIKPNGLLHQIPLVGGYYLGFTRIAVAPDNTILGDTGHSVYSFSQGQQKPFAGAATSGFYGDGGPAAKALLSWIGGLTSDKEGNVYLSDSSNQRIRRVTPDGLISTFAGTGDGISNGDGGPASAAAIGDPEALAFDPFGNLYVATDARSYGR